MLFVSHWKKNKLFACSEATKYSPMFSSKNRSSRIDFCIRCNVGDNIFFPCGFPIDPGPFINKSILGMEISRDITVLIAYEGDLWKMWVNVRITFNTFCC